MPVTPPPFPAARPRRMRRSAALRAMMQENALTPADFIWPVFVMAGEELAVPWTNPEDLVLDADSFEEVMSKMPKPEFWIGTIEGAALSPHSDGSFGVFQSMASINGGEISAADAMFKEKSELIKSGSK